VGALSLTVAVASCSSDDDERRDQRYGSDAGAGYHLPKDAAAGQDSSGADAAGGTTSMTDQDAGTGDAAALPPDAPQGEAPDANVDGAGDASTG
jgi:hypothetical protein